MVDVSIVTDSPERSGQISRFLEYYFDVELVELASLKRGPAPTDCVIVIDCNISQAIVMADIKAAMKTIRRAGEALFLADGWNHTGHMPASFGGGEVLNRNCDPAEILHAVTVRQRAFRPHDPRIPGDVRAVLDRASDLTPAFAGAARQKAPLPKGEIEAVGRQVADVLRQRGIETWAHAVRAYHSHTYRHSMLVTGYAVMFGQKLELVDADVELLAVTGLLHDIGKLKIPLTILDKPAGLTAEERGIIRRHPVFSREILLIDAQFGPEVIDAALQHHEYLDGTGYPAGLQAADLRPLTRMVTIVDVYCALTEFRPYRPARTPTEALRAMGAMGDKLDRRLLAAFRAFVDDIPFGRALRSEGDAAPRQPILAEGRIHPLDQVRAAA